MNKWHGIGRLCGDPEIRYTQDDKATCIARYRLAVDRKGRKDGGQPEADFIPCVAFGKNGEFAEKYLKKGMKIAVVGRIQTGSYTNKDGSKVYTTDIVVEEHEFCESKQPGTNTTPENSGNTGGNQQSVNTFAGGFMNIPDGIEEELPFT